MFTIARSMSCLLALAALRVAVSAQDTLPAVPDPDLRLPETLRDRLALRDPEADMAWESERTHVLVQQRLGIVRDWLLDPERDPGGPALDLADDLAAAPLHSPGGTPVFVSEVFSVVRSEAPSAPEGARVGLTERLSSLARLFGGPGGAPEQVHFETFDVALGEPGVAVRSRVRLAGRVDGGALECTATWHTRWIRTGDGELALAQVDVTGYEEVRTTGGPLFEDCTRTLIGPGRLWRDQLAPGMDHWRARLDTRLGLPILGHPAGIAIGDVNGDGREDVFLGQPGGLPNLLLVHRPDGTVHERAAEAGLDHLDFTRAALLFDFDADDDDDLAAVIGSSLVFFENDGRGVFEQRGVHEVGNATSLAAADFDADGDVDLYVCAYFALYEGAAAESVPSPYHDARNGQPNALFANDGDWIFSDVTASAGLDAENSRFSFAAAWEDYDDDGDQDLYVANDFGPNNLYRNDGGRFVDVAELAGVEDVAAGMGVAWGDVDGDGRMDLYVSNMYSFAGNRLTAQAGFQAASDELTRRAFRRHARGNSLFLNRGDGTFREVGDEFGVALGRWSWGSVWLDMDNNGLLDLAVPNGFLTAERADEL